MRIDPAGLPFIAGSLAPAAAALLARRPRWAVPFAAAAGFMLFFFRDPDRAPLSGDHLVLAPADGRVVVAGQAEPGVAPPGEWQQVSIFLSPLDVHVNRMPFTGRVDHVEYRPGRFLPAYEPGAAAENERSEVWITQGDRTVVARQIVGVLARRVVCRAVAGTLVRAGDRFGVMKFGSRMDVFVPPAATLDVRVGDRVRAAETVLARFPEPAR
ncbi:MAG: phosphatidylserine decarboxylase [Vicinamibacterales bacterium]|jgi:phosphatidylserine decarboxylase|nr:phosphatidylserine decarboxylase [Vicinamibacterales bacterium]